MGERRRAPQKGHAARDVELPLDFLKMVKGVVEENFQDALQILKGMGHEPRFEASGNIYPNEIVLSLSLHFGDDLGATTVHASVDFDPKASAPKAEDLLSMCLDVAASFWATYLDPKDPERIRLVGEKSLSALLETSDKSGDKVGAKTELPLLWSPVKINKRDVFLKIDRSNPKLDKMTDQWLEKNDPDIQSTKLREEAETEKLFVTGKKQVAPGDDEDSGGTIH